VQPIDAAPLRARFLSEPAELRRHAQNLRWIARGPGVLLDAAAEAEAVVARIEAGDRWGAAREVVTREFGEAVWREVAGRAGAATAFASCPSADAFSRPSSQQQLPARGSDS